MPVILSTMAQEIYNKLSKAIVKHMGSNKNIKSISTICKSMTGLKEVTENADKEIGLKKSSSKHKTLSSKDDEVLMIADIIKLKPFDHNADRQHNSFPDIRPHPTRYMDVPDFHDWIEKQRKHLM